MNKSGIILLTSTGLSSQNVYDKFGELTRAKNFKKAVLITTASLHKEKNQYSQLAFSQLKSLEFETVEFYDFEEDLKKDLSSYDVIYVCGGNTFKLMKFAKNADFKKDIEALLQRGGAYIGVSAGSLIVGPSIKLASEVHPDINEVDLTDFEGFNILDITVFPHYLEEFEEEIKLFEKRNKTTIMRLTNVQAILIEEGKETLVG